MRDKKQYRDAARLIEAIDSLLTHFKDYQDVTQINRISQTVKRLKVCFICLFYLFICLFIYLFYLFLFIFIYFYLFLFIFIYFYLFLISFHFKLKDDLKDSIFRDFHNYNPDRPVLENAQSVLHDGCLVIDVLGEKLKNDLIGWFCNKQVNIHFKFNLILI